MRVFYRCCLALGFSIGVYAGEKETPDEKARVVYQKKTSIDFSDVWIHGELVKPQGAYLKTRKEAGFDSMIELKSNFREELLQSVDEL